MDERERAWSSSSSSTLHLETRLDFSIQQFLVLKLAIKLRSSSSRPDTLLGSVSSLSLLHVSSRTTNILACFSLQKSELPARLDSCLSLRLGCSTSRLLIAWICLYELFRWWRISFELLMIDVWSLFLLSDEFSIEAQDCSLQWFMLISIFPLNSCRYPLVFHLGKKTCFGSCPNCIKPTWDPPGQVSWAQSCPWWSSYHWQS